MSYSKMVETGADEAVCCSSVKCPKAALRAQRGSVRTLHVESRAAVLIGHILLKRGDFVRKLRIFRPKKSATRFPIITKLRKARVFTRLRLRVYACLRENWVGGRTELKMSYSKWLTYINHGCHKLAE